MAQAQNPLKQIVAIERHEWPLALAFSSYFFLVISTFWVLKPLKKETLVGFYQDEPLDLFGWMLNGSEAEQLAKILNMIVAFAAVLLFSWLSDRVQREKLTFVWASAMAACLIGFSAVIDSPGPLTAWLFYLFGDLFNTVMVASFFAFANDAIASEGAKRLYGVIGLGGVAGGAFGTTTLRATLGLVDDSTWMWICAGAMGLVCIAAALAARLAQRSGGANEEGGRDTDERASRSGALAAARLVGRSRYLLALVALVGIYELVSTVMDFQFTATVEYYASRGELNLEEAFRNLYAFTNVTALVVQLFVTSFVMQRFGVAVALFFLPVAALTGSMAFLVYPVFLTGAALSASDNAFNYSINQSARETLYTVTSREEKYKAKAFIDMFVQRTAKSAGVGVNLLMTALVASFAGVRYLTFVTVPLLVLWLLVVRFLGIRFDQREAEQAGAGSSTALQDGDGPRDEQRG